MSTLSPPSLGERASLVNENLLRSPAIARLAGALMVATGFFVLGTAVQLVALHDSWVAQLFTLPLWLFGALALILSPQVYNARGWASVLGTLVALGAAASTIVWLLYALAALMFAPMLLLGVSASLLAVFVVPFAIGPAIEVSRARSALW